MFKKIIVPLFAVSLVISGCSKETTKAKPKEQTEQNKQKIPLKISGAKIEKVNKSTLKVDVTAKGENLKYAYYIYKDTNIVEKIGYKPEASLTYEVKEPGTYKVKVYAKDKAGKIETRYTSEVKIEK